MFYRGDSKTLKVAFLLLVLGFSSACQGGGSSEVTEIIVTSTPFYSASLAGAVLTPGAPTIDDNLTGFGITDFFPDGLFSSQSNLSNGSKGSAFGSYSIDPDGKMTVEIDGGTSLHGAVNPVEDILFLAGTNVSDDGRVRLQLAVTPVFWEGDGVPDFTGTYHFLGVQFLFPENPPIDLNQNARTVSATMFILQENEFGGSFIIDGFDSNGDDFERTGSFAIGGNLDLLFSVDDEVPGEVWMGSFALSGLILLSDISAGNQDAGIYAAIPDAQFIGPGPLTFDGIYRVVKLRFSAEEGIPFATALEGAIRTFNSLGFFSDSCDSQFPCSGINVNIPYNLDPDGTLTLYDPSLGPILEGVITPDPDLSAFVAVEIGSSSGELPHENTFVIGVRLLSEE